MSGKRTRRASALIGVLCVCVLGAPAPGKSQSFIWPLSRSTDGSAPLDRLNSPFGPRIRPSDQSYEFHEGIDLAGPAGSDVQIGDPVFAAASGIASLLTDDGGCIIHKANETAPPGCQPVYPGGGRIVRLDHGGSLYTLYLHLSRQADGLTTTPGQQTVVSAGDQIGEVGMTGQFAAIPHLHFEVRNGGVGRDFAQNALGYLPRAINQAPVITGMSVTPSNGTAEVSVDIENAPDGCRLAPDCDVDLNRVVLRIRDGDGTQIDEKAVDFDGRENVAPANPEVNNIRIIPIGKFNRFDSTYRWSIVFKAVPAVSQDSYEVQAIDVLGLSAFKQATLP